MSRRGGDTLGGVSSLTTQNITRPASYAGTTLALTLPTTEPGASQLIVTVAAGDMFVAGPTECLYAAMLVLAGVNNDGATRTISWRILRNGSSVATGSFSATTTQAYTAQGGILPATGVQVGDTVELRLWSASSTNVSVLYSNYWLVDTRHGLPKRGNYAQDVTVTFGANLHPAAITGGTAATKIAGQSNSIMFAGDLQGNTKNNSTTEVYSGCRAGPSVGIIKVGNGDANFPNTVQSNVNAAATGYPRVNASSVPTQLKYRRVPFNA